MCITQTEETSIHPIMDGNSLLGMYSPAHDVVRPLFRADLGKVDVKAEQVHVEHEPVVVHAVCGAMSREAMAYTAHAGVKALHGLVQTMMCVAPHHGVSMTQLLLVGLQELIDHHRYRRVDSYPPGGKRLKKMGKQESVPTEHYA